MPSIIDQIRKQQAWEQPQKPGLWPLILGVAAAFTVGLVGVYSWNYLAGSSPKTALQAQSGPRNPETTVPVEFDERGRLGTAENSNLLKTCMPMKSFGQSARGADPGRFYRVLQDSSASRGAARLPGHEFHSIDSIMLAVTWGEIADCVFKQNSWDWCDPDNRTLAIETINTFVRRVNIVTSEKADPNHIKSFAEVRASVDRQRRLDYEIQAAQSLKTRLLAALRTRIEEGRVIAADFRSFGHDDVRHVVQGTMPKQNACANRG